MELYGFVKLRLGKAVGSVCVGPYETAYKRTEGANCVLQVLRISEESGGPGALMRPVRGR